MDDETLDKIADTALKEDFAIVSKHAQKTKERNLFTNHIIFVIPGIRDQGHRCELVVHILEEHIPTARVVPLPYGYFGVIRFLFPHFRKKQIEKIYKKMCPAMNAARIQHISVIAHSFGTYIFVNLLPKFKHKKFYRILFCGGIVSKDFDPIAINIDNRHSARCHILNDCGTEDIWPVIAESVSNAFGASGVYGFGNYAVYDRFHHVNHGGYFKKEFIENYWVDFIKSGHIKNGISDLQKSHSHNLLSMPFFRLKHSVPLLMAILFYWSIF